MNPVPDISRAEVEARRREETIEAAAQWAVESGPMRARLLRGGTPNPAPPSTNENGARYFTFGNALDDENGVPLAPF